MAKKTQTTIKLQPTAIPALDQMLHGGIPAGSTVLLAGSAGTGKTILGMQWLFAGQREFGENGLYMSLTEPVGKLMKNISTMSFYDPTVTDAEKGNVQFWDLRGLLKPLGLNEGDWKEEDLWKLVDAIGALVVKSGAQRVVLDSVTALCQRLEHNALIRQLIFALGTTLSHLDATVLLISEAAEKSLSVYGVEEFIADGIIHVTYQTEGRMTRFLRIIKMRGSAFNEHSAALEISTDGITLHPHTEGQRTQIVANDRMVTGISGLDTMTTGGYLAGSSVFISGASGCGKSTMGLQFIVSAIAAGQKAVYVSFEETAPQIERNASAYCWDLATPQKEGTLFIMAESADSRSLQSRLTDIETLVTKGEAKALVIDSLSALGHNFPLDQVYDFCQQLVGITRANGVTLLCTAASDSLLSTEAIADMELSTFFDQIILLRYIEIESELRKGLVILKMRGSDHDRRMREIAFGKGGLRIAADFSDYEGVMTGHVRRVTRSMEEKLHSIFLEFLGSQGEQLFLEQKSQGISLEGLQALIKELGEKGELPKERLAEFMSRVEELLV